MRVLHVHTRYRERGGEDSVVDAERRLLRDSGFEVAMLDFENPVSRFDSVLKFAQAPWNRAAIKRSIATAKEFGADVVHIHNTWFALSPGVVSGLRQAGFPVAMTFHNYRLVCVNALLFRDARPCEACVGGSTLPGVRYRCYRDSYASSAMASLTVQIHRGRQTWAEDLSVAIVLTEFAKERLLHGGLPAARTVVKPNFVVDPGRRTSLPSESNEVLFVGRLTKEKGIDRLLAAWQQARLDKFELNVIGEAPGSSSIELGCEGVRLLGRLEPKRVREAMLSSRALVVPSLWFEGQPMVILEALAAGLPVLHTDLGALGETCGRGGLSIGSGDQRQMVAGLHALNDGILMDNTGEKGREEFERRFSDRVALDALRGIYSLALG